MTAPKSEDPEDDGKSNKSLSAFSFRITGQVARSRIQPLLLLNKESTTQWIEHTTSAQENNIPDFLWENAPRRDTGAYRDAVRCYSHLPNGTSILDSKWVLGRLMGSSSSNTNDNKYLAVLETLCFRGSTGFAKFAKTVGLLSESNQKEPKSPLRFRDLMEDDDDDEIANCEQEYMYDEDPPNMWVIKDAYSNGAGGIWVVGRANVDKFMPAASTENNSNSILTETHSYVAQRYAWPPVTFRQRKCHVRVYALLCSDGSAHVHRKCFLHVANDPFQIHTTTTTTDNSNPFQDSVHITNCCANSHDDTKFAGEICADLESQTHSTNGPADHDLCLGLAKFFPSIQASVAALAQRTFPFLNGGQANHGFEYLGLDFILSYDSSNNVPIAYLLEVNAPPSQDTATGLPHAEDTHNAVIRDLLTLWVYPNVAWGATAPVRGGWRCVYTDPHYQQQQNEQPDTTTEAILPSKAAILNKIRWTLYERKQLALEKKVQCKDETATTTLNNDETTANHHCSTASFANYARSFFPYYNQGMNDATTTSQASSPPPIFFENAGGTQVPSPVIDAVTASLKSRHRAGVGAQSVAAAKQTLGSILGASSPDQYSIFLGANASAALFTLAQRYVQSGLLAQGDEILLRTDNHLANVQPWLDAAQAVGAVVRWWDDTSCSPVVLEDLVTTRTRIVAVPHASNVLGTVVDLASIRATVDRLTPTSRPGHIVVDGVAAVPHRFAAVDELQMDWYVVSCHKMFGPHLGVLCGRTSIANHLLEGGGDGRVNNLQMGTVNYEAARGVCGLGSYLAKLSKHSLHLLESHNRDESQEVVVSASSVREAYRLIQKSEAPLVKALLSGLQSSPKVRVIENPAEDSVSRLPLVCFLHDDISCREIVAQCSKGGVVCRHGTFLSTSRLQNEQKIDDAEGVVRFSLAHYNTVSEVNHALHILHSLPGWF